MILHQGTRYLRKKGTDEAFVWTEILAARKDMEEIAALADITPALDLDQDSVPPPITREALTKSSRDELIALAESHGIPNPGRLSTKRLLTVLTQDMLADDLP